MPLRSLAIAIIVFASTINLSCQKDKGPAFAKNNERDNCLLRIIFPYIEEQSPTPQEQSAKAEPPHWYTLPEWWLLILGIPTLADLLWQANETRRAGQAARGPFAQRARGQR